MGCFGLILQIWKGNTYFTEWAERVEYGNHGPANNANAMTAATTATTTTTTNNNDNKNNNSSNNTSNDNATTTTTTTTSNTINNNSNNNSSSPASRPRSPSRPRATGRFFSSLSQRVGVDLTVHETL